MNFCKFVIYCVVLNISKFLMAFSYAQLRSLSLLRNYVRMAHVSSIPTKFNTNTRTTGAFKRSLPEVFHSSTHFKRALKGIRKIKYDSNIKNVRNMNRKYAAESLDALMKELTIPITRALKIFAQTVVSLHPFEVNDLNRLH